MQKLFLRVTAVLTFGLLSANAVVAQQSDKAKVDETKADEAKNHATNQYYATLDRGLAEAKRTGKPILFVSAAPHCAGVSGMW